MSTGALPSSMILGKVHADLFPCDGGGASDVYNGRLRHDERSPKVAVKALRFYKGSDSRTIDTVCFNIMGDVSLFF